MKEEWRNIKGYEGYYQVSNFGRVRSLDRKVPCKGGKCFKKGTILSQRFNRVNKTYIKKEVALCKFGKCTTTAVHRLVGKAFIPNPENKPQINHKDFDPTNNHIDNLEWCTVKENIQHAWKLGIHSKLRNERNHKSIPVVAYIYGEKIGEFKNYTRCAEFINKKYGTMLNSPNIGQYVLGKRVNRKGFTFEKRGNQNE